MLLILSVLLLLLVACGVQDAPAADTTAAAEETVTRPATEPPTEPTETVIPTTIFSNEAVEFFRRDHHFEDIVFASFDLTQE